MKKILFITIHLPYPPNKGASVYNTFKLIKHLVKGNHLHIVSLLKEEDASYQDSFVNRFPGAEFTFEPVNIPRSAKNLLLSYFKNIPLNIYRSKSPNLKRYIKNIANQYDILFIDHYEAFQYVPKGYQGKVFLRIHNAEFQIWKRYASLQTNILKKLVLNFESERIKILERKCAKRADVILGPVEDNKQIEPDNIIRANKFVDFTFLGDESQLTLPVPEFGQLENSIMYVGTLTWEPNIDGLIWFIENCYEKIKSVVPDVKVYIIGNDPDQRLVDLVQKYENIYLTGFVENLEDYFTKCKVNIVPLRFGGGIKVKLINGLYRGIPIVSTSIGIESTYATPGLNVLVADEPALFAEYVLLLLHDEQRWNMLSNESRKLASGKYTWNALYSQLDTIFSR